MESHYDLFLGVDDHAITNSPEKGIAESLVEWVKGVDLFNEAHDRSAAHIQIRQLPNR